MLTPDDAAAVLRRAAELDTPSLEQHDALDEHVVRDAAREVGLSGAAVDQAVAEWRAGVLAPLPPLGPDRWAGLPGSVTVEGRVPLPPDQAQAALDIWLHGQWFERARRRGPETEWTPRRGLLAKARKAADLDGRLRLGAVGRVRLCVAPASSGSRVRVVADLGDTRAGLLTGMVAAPALLVGAGVVVIAGGGADVLLAVPAALGTGGAGWLGARSTLASRRTALTDELERVLDQLAHQQPRAPLPQRAAAWATSRLPRALR